MRSPCLDCGELATGSRCEACAERVAKVKAPELPRRNKLSSTARGYDSRWRRLSERARKLQRFCSDCGSIHDLQADHTPEAWLRKSRGLEIRLRDIDVVCGDCNRARGAARGEAVTRHS